MEGQGRLLPGESVCANHRSSMHFAFLSIHYLIQWQELVHRHLKLLKQIYCGSANDSTVGRGP